MAIPISQKQYLYWFAKLKEGTILQEQQSSFEEIDKSELLFFGMASEDKPFSNKHGFVLSHNLNNGDCFINNNKINVFLNNKKLGITNDIVHLKERVTSVNQDYIASYYAGFREEHPDFSDLECLFWIDVEHEEIKLKLSLSNAQSKNNVFKIKTDEKVFQETLDFETNKQSFIFSL